MSLHETTFKALGVPIKKSAPNLSDPYSAGGTDVGLSPAGQTYWRDLQKMLSGDVYGSTYRPFNLNLPTTAPTLDLNQLGLTGGQQAGFNEAVNQAVSRLSGNFANRGLNTPRANDAIAGSAAQYVLPQFAPLMTQNLQGLFQQQYEPAAFGAQLGAQTEMARRQLAGQLEQQRINQMLGLLEQQRATTQRGPGLGYEAARDATSNWYKMWNNIGSFWGGGGGMGGAV